MDRFFSAMTGRSSSLQSGAVRKQRKVDVTRHLREHQDLAQDTRVVLGYPPMREGALTPRGLHRVTFVPVSNGTQSTNFVVPTSRSRSNSRNSSRFSERRAENEQRRLERVQGVNARLNREEKHQAEKVQRLPNGMTPEEQEEAWRELEETRARIERSSQEQIQRFQQEAEEAQRLSPPRKMTPEEHEQALRDLEEERETVELRSLQRALEAAQRLSSQAEKLRSNSEPTSSSQRPPSPLEVLQEQVRKTWSSSSNSRSDCVFQCHVSSKASICACDPSPDGALNRTL